MNDRILRALRRETVDCTPVWFMRQAGRTLPRYRDSRADRDMFEILRDPPAAAAITRGEVVFEDVSFSYDGVTPVLNGIDLHEKPGDLVALVGPTGAGKTTIVNVLTRFYEIDSGRILVDGVDLSDLRKSELRREMGIVLQDSFLYAMEYCPLGSLAAPARPLR